MNAHERAVEALEQDVHSKSGWLSDAQEANLRVSYDSLVSFAGAGSINLNHLVSIVMVALKEENNAD